MKIAAGDAAEPQEADARPDQARAEQRQPVLLGACLVGASVGFLWFNSFPAAIFMGDTGSLGLAERSRGWR